MGAIVNNEEEQRAILHLNNAPQIVKLMHGVYLKDFALVESATNHIKTDLERWGL